MPVLLHLSKKPKLYVGMVSHSGGILVSMAWTLDEVKAKVACYCREWWDDLPFDSGPVDGLNDLEVIEEYFGNVDGEHWDWHVLTVPPLPGGGEGCET